MQKDKKSKNDNIEKLRKILDNIPSKDLHPKDEKYLKALSKRLEESSKGLVYKKAVSKDDSKKEIDLLKPKVTIHPREVKKVLEFTEIKEEKTELEIEEPSTVEPLPAKEIRYEDEDVFEVEKVEVSEPEFVEVKPKEITKEEKEEVFEEKKALGEEELTEWEAVEKASEKEEIKEELPEWKPIDKEEHVVKEELKETEISEEKVEDKERIEVTDKFCGQCGAKLREEADFCPDCGNKITTDKEKLEKDEFEPVEEIEPVPTFIPVKEVEEKKEEIKTEEEPVKPEEEMVEVEGTTVEEIYKEPGIDRESKIEAFKDMESVDDETAVILYDSGYTTIDALTVASLKDLTKIKGIKRKKAKNIKKEIEEKSEWKPVEIKEEPIEEKETFKPEPIEEEIIERDEKIEAFKDIESIDDETSFLLYDSGYTTIDFLKEATLKDLIKIKGIKRKVAKNIKKEIENKIKEAAEVKPIVMRETAEGELTEDQIQEEVVEKEDKTPSPVELKTESSEWKPVKDEELEEPKEPEPDTDREDKIEVFKDIECINDETAVLLYDNGFITIDALTVASLKDLTKIKGIKRNTAKRIKKEIDKKSEWKPLEVEEEKVEEPEKEKDVSFIDEEAKKDEASKIDEKILEYVPAKAEGEFFEEEKIEDVPPIKVDEEDVFKDINSIDEKITKLLKENGINSIYDLRNTTVKELTKIKGIKRKIAKQIKKEVEAFSADKYAEEIVPKESFERGENPFIKEEEEDEWESFDEDKISDSELREIKGFRHGDYTLYAKEIDTKSGKKRTVRFFSKAEPEEGEPIELPKGYKVEKNKKTGVPYLKKKK